MSTIQIPDTTKTRLIFALIATLITTMLYWGMTDHLFDADDMEYLIDTQRVWEDPARFLSSHRAFPGRPTVEIVFLLVFPLFGENPAAYHLLLIGLHIFAGLVLCHTLRRFGITFELSLLTSFLFLINVAHFRAVHWIACLSYPIALILGLYALLCFERYLKGNRRSLFYALLWIALAVCAHVGAATLTLFAAYRAYQQGQTLTRSALSALPLIAIAGALSIALYLLFPKASQVLAVVHEPSLIRTAKFFLWFLSRLITAAHWWPDSLSGQPHIYELAIGMAATLGILFLILRNRQPAASAAFWTALTILPFINNPHLIMFGPSRYLYFASVGSCLLFACGILTTTNRFSQRTAQIITVGMLILLTASSAYALKRGEALSLYHAGRSYIGKMVEHTGADLMERALSRDPQLARIVPQDVYVRLSITLFSLGRSPAPYLNQALSQNPDDPQLNILLGVENAMSSDPQQQNQGLAAIQNHTSTDTQNKLIAARGFTNIGRFALRQGNYKRAVHTFKNAHTYWPNDALTRLLLAHALFIRETGLPVAQTDSISTRLQKAIALRTQPDQAIDLLQQTLQPVPDHAPLYEYLAILLLEREEFTSALTHLEHATKLAPNSPHAYHTQAQILQMLGQHRTAFQSLQHLLRLIPQNPAVYYNLGLLFETVGETTLANQYFNEALKRNPNLFTN